MSDLGASKQRGAFLFVARRARRQLRQHGDIGLNNTPGTDFHDTK
jgi:hypothetical protein